MSVKPILFNTQMVQAIQSGKKTMTRRVIKPQPEGVPRRLLDGSCYPDCWGCEGSDRVFAPPYQPGDVLWVREAWAHPSEAEIKHGADAGEYLYKADQLQPCAWNKWRPSIHMPKQAARIFLRVKDVRAEVLSEISNEDIQREGVEWRDLRPQGCKCRWAFEGCQDGECGNRDAYVHLCWVRPFADLWNSTIKPAERDAYGWDAWPWVWVIEFERCERPEGWAP